MRDIIIAFVKNHYRVAHFLWAGMRFLLKVWGLFIPVKEQTIIFSSYGGRKFDDSPKALYDKICTMDEFRDWKLIWAFVNPDDFILSRGDKVKIDTFQFFKTLLSTQVWVGNSEIDRGIRLFSFKHIRIETWHGTPLKKICGEENQTSVERILSNRKIDKTTIRCAQSEYDRTIFSRLFSASKSAILLSDLPRNDSLLTYTQDRLYAIKEKLGINGNKKVILYAPTYREYLTNNKGENSITPPINFNKWENVLGEEYVLLIRAHYVVTEIMNLPTTPFVINVSNYACLNDLYAISDMMISDYSSTFFDYAIFDRPMFCFAYDLDEYSEKRGLYLDLEKELPCTVDRDEDSLLTHIKNVDYAKASKATKNFHERYAPYAGHACDRVIDVLLNRLKDNRL